jgi:hypothetical protein
MQKFCLTKIEQAIYNQHRLSIITIQSCALAAPLIGGDKQQESLCFQPVTAAYNTRPGSRNTPDKEKLAMEKRRYSLVLPLEVWTELEKVADEHGTTMVDLIRRYLKLGLIVTNAEKQNKALVLKDDLSEQEIRIIF